MLVDIRLVYIYIYIYIEKIDCDDSDCMIEIYKQLDKSNTEIRFRCVIFCSFYSKELFQTETVF